MITYHTAQLDDLKTLLAWAAEEGWNPGLDDADAFYAADPEGFFVAVDGQTPVAGISVVNHTDTFAFLGLYIVRPAYRGKGIGFTLWTHAMAHAGPRTVGLDGVEDQQANYARSGFAHAGSTTRYTGTVEAAHHTLVRPVTDADRPDLIDMEAAGSGVHKPSYLQAWLSDTETRKTLVFQTNDRPEGFCTVRQCETGVKIGPLVATSSEVARSLIKSAASVFGSDITIDVPKSSTALDQLCQNLHLSPGFRTARMYRGPFETGNAKLFAVASLELG